MYEIEIKKIIKNKMNVMKNTLSAKLKTHLVNVYRNKNRFNLIWLIPILYVPINYFSSTINQYYPYSYYVLITLVTSVFGFYILSNAVMIKLTWQNKINSDALDHRNGLSYRDDVLRVLYITAPIFIMLFLFLFSVAYFQTGITQIIKNTIPALYDNQIQTGFSILGLIIVYAFIPMLVISLFLIIHMFVHEKGKDFSLELTRSWFLSIDDVMTDSQKMNRLINGIECYDEHLVTYLRQRINDIDYLCTRLIADSENVSNIVYIVRQKFQINDLELLKHFLNLNKDGKIHLIQPTRSTLYESILNRIKSIAIIISAIITILNHQSFIDTINKIFIK